MRQYKKEVYGDKDYYKEEFYKIRMVESLAYHVSNGPDDFDIDWEVGQSYVLGVNELTTKEFNRAYSIYVKKTGYPVRTFFNEENLDKKNSNPGKYYVYEWEAETNHQLNIDVLGMNLGYEIHDDDREALASL